jgi:exosortase/archaeosortase family protein
VPTDTARTWTHAGSFTLRAVAWSLGLFGLLRLNWVEAHGLLPLTQLQGRLAVGLCGVPASPIDATLACSGADALALCVGAILAYPASWRMRLAGAGGGLGLILGLNTLRIGTLGRAAASPAWFETLHVYLWPAVLTLAIAGYVFAWMRVADGGDGVRSHLRESLTRDAAPATASSPAGLTRRFVILTAALLLLFTAASPLYLESAGVLAVAAFVARAAAAVLHVLGVEASAAANVLWTSRGGFTVTQECVSTPLIPVYLAAVLAYSRTWRWGALGLLAMVPLFVGLGIARLLVVALPAALVASPLFLVHAFFQLLLGAVVVFLAAFWRAGTGGTALRRALLAVLLGVAFVRLLGAPYAWLVTSAAEALGGAAPLHDPQGAIAALPAFQVGLYLALWVAAFAAAGWRRLLAGLALLALTQAAGLIALHVLARHSGLMPHVADVRAWAVVGPLLVIAAVVNAGRLRGRSAPLISSAS